LLIDYCAAVLKLSFQLFHQKQHFLGFLLKLSLHLRNDLLLHFVYFSLNVLLKASELRLRLFLLFCEKLNLLLFGFHDFFMVFVHFLNKMFLRIDFRLQFGDFFFELVIFVRIFNDKRFSLVGFRRFLMRGVFLLNVIRVH